MPSPPAPPKRPHFEVAAIVENIDGEITEVFTTAAQANTRVSELQAREGFVDHGGVSINTEYVVTVKKRPGKKVPTE